MMEEAPKGPLVSMTPSEGQKRFKMLDEKRKQRRKLIRMMENIYFSRLLRLWQSYPNKRKLFICSLGLHGFAKWRIWRIPVEGQVFRRWWQKDPFKILKISQRYNLRCTEITNSMRNQTRPGLKAPLTVDRSWQQRKYHFLTAKHGKQFANHHWYWLKPQEKVQSIFCAQKNGVTIRSHMVFNIS